MKRFLALISLCLLLSAPAFSNHITGGEIFYKLITDNGDGTYTYAVTLKLFRNCGNVGAQLDPNAAIGVFDRFNGTTITTLSVALGKVEELQITDPGPCITNPPSVCYQVGYYEFSLTLPASTNGYIITYQRCCRIAGINNVNGSSSVGATYTAEVPGTSPMASAPANNSAKFTGRDTVIVCANNAFLYNFGAVDDDANDVLTYYFCDAYEGGAAGSPAPNPPLPPPYPSVSYTFPYSGGSPLGSTINIDANTGLITGIAPAAGIYVVTVCVKETRNGVLIATQRKDLQIKIGDCDIAKAVLEPQYISCDGYTLDFSNLNSSPLINSFYWEFGDLASGVNNSSNIPNPSHTFSDTGIYKIRLVTNRNQDCSDSTEAFVKVYPGFFPDFNFGGYVLQNPLHSTMLPLQHTAL
jgi:PKD repeat protein